MCYESDDFIISFGHMLRLQDEVRRLGAVVLYELSKALDGHAIINADENITKAAFYGAHLRTDKDAAQSKWLPYDVQSKLYLEQAVAANLSMIYVASGNEVISCDSKRKPGRNTKYRLRARIFS